MFIPLRTVVFSMLCAAVPACAQEGKADKKQEPAKAEAKADAKAAAKPAAGKDDAAKDPVVQAIDELAKKVDTKSATWRVSLAAPPKQTFAADTNYYWLLKTNKGDVKVHLFADSAPMHVTSTIYLTRLGFYDGLKFHRVIKNFMAQGGCPLGNGTGGPGYKYAGEFEGSHKHDKPGMLSMANAGPGTDGSQFFLTFVKTPWLDGKHTIFGEVVEGLETLKALEACGSQSGQTSEPLMIERATIAVEKAAPKDAKKDAAK